MRRRLPKFLLPWSTFLSLLLVFSIGAAAETPSSLTVSADGVYLFAGQDERSAKIAALAKGDELAPLGQLVGISSWFLVRTKTGAVGWVKSSEVTAAEPVERIFKDTTASRLSTWIAETMTGRRFTGTWTVEPGLSTGDALGTWTLRNETGQIVMRGSWSASKFLTGWNGVWRAAVDGQSGEYSGSWSADPSLPRDAPFGEMFAAAAKDAIRGIWNATTQSGSWSIRAAK